MCQYLDCAYTVALEIWAQDKGYQVKNKIKHSTVPQFCFMCLSSALVEYVKAADVKVIAALGDSLTVSDVTFFYTEKYRNSSTFLFIF